MTHVPTLHLFHCFQIFLPFTQEFLAVKVTNSIFGRLVIFKLYKSKAVLEIDITDLTWACKQVLDIMLLSISAKTTNINSVWSHFAKGIWLRIKDDFFFLEGRGPGELRNISPLPQQLAAVIATPLNWPVQQHLSLFPTVSNGSPLISGALYSKIRHRPPLYFTGRNICKITLNLIDRKIIKLKRMNQSKPRFPNTHKKNNGKKKWGTVIWASSVHWLKKSFEAAANPDQTSFFSDLTTMSYAQRPPRNCYNCGEGI